MKKSLTKWPKRDQLCLVKARLQYGKRPPVTETCAAYFLAPGQWDLFTRDRITSAKIVSWRVAPG